MGSDGQLTVCFRSKDVEIDDAQARMMLSAIGVAPRRVVDVMPGRHPIDSHPTDRVATVANANRRAVAECYQRELARDPELGGGTVVVKFVIATDGKVTSSTVERTTLSSRPVEACVVSEVRRWTFPAAGETEPTTVRFPFKFSRP